MGDWFKAYDFEDVTPFTEIFRHMVEQFYPD